MDNPFVRTLYCRVCVSRWLCQFNSYAHVLALAVILALSLYRPVLSGLALAVLYSCWWQRRALRLQRNHSICRLRWRPDDTWLWQLRDGTECKGGLVHATVLGRFFVLLHLRRQGQKWGTTAVPLAADSLSAEAHRHLRARLTLWAPERRGHDAMALLQGHMGRMKAFVFRR